MSKEDERIALVALTEYQIRLLITLIRTYGGKITYIKEDRLEKALEKLQIALYALQHEEK